MKEKPFDKRVILSSLALIVYALFAGASAEDLGVMTLIAIGAVAAVVIIMLINESNKKSKRENAITTMTDFSVTKKFDVNSSSSICYDEKRNKLRLINISNGEQTKDIDNVTLGSVVPFAGRYFVENKLDKSVLLVTPSSLKYEIVENFVPVKHEVAGNSIFAVDQEHSQILAANGAGLAVTYKTASFFDILSVEVLENGNTISSKSATRTVGGAVVGGVLAGGAGAIVGGLSGKSKESKEVTAIKVKIVLRKIQDNQMVIGIFSGKLNTKNATELKSYNSYINQANKIRDIVSVIIDAVDKQNDAQKIKAVNKGNANTSNSVADELAKLADLKAKGILTEEEFNQQKSKLLDGNALQTM